MCSVIKLYKIGTTFQKIHSQIVQRSPKIFPAPFSTRALKNGERVELLSSGFEKKLQNQIVQRSPKIFPALFSTRGLKNGERAELLSSSFEKVSKNFKKIQYSKIYAHVEIHDAWDMDAFQEDVEEPEKMQDFKFEELARICTPPDNLPAEEHYPNAQADQYINGIETQELYDIYDFPEGRPLKTTPTENPNAENCFQFHKLHTPLHDRLPAEETGFPIDDKLQNIFNFKGSVDLTTAQTALTEDLKASSAKLHEVHTEKETEHPCAKAAQYINGIETFDLCHMHELESVLVDPLFKAGVSDDPKAEAAKQFSGTEIHDKVENIVNFKQSVDLQTALTEDLKASSAKLHEVHTEEETEYPCAKAAQYINGIDTFDLCHMHELESVLVDPLFKAGVSDDPKAEAAKQFSGTEIHDKVENIVNFKQSVDLQTALTEDLKASSAKLHEVHTEEETEYPCAKAAQYINGIDTFDLCHMHELESVLVDPLFKAGVSDDPRVEAANQFGGTEIHDKVENIFNFNESVDLQTALTEDLKASSAKLHEVHTEEETEYPCAKAAQYINGIDTFDLCHMHELESVLVDPLFKAGVSDDPRVEAANQFGGTEIHDKVENIFNFNESVDLQTALTEDLKASSAKLHEVHTEKETEYPCAKAAQYINGIDTFDLCHMHELEEVLVDPLFKAGVSDDPRAEAANQFGETEIHDKVENIFNFNESVDLQTALTEDLKASSAKLHEVHTEEETEYPCAKAAQCINGIEIFDLCHMHELESVLVDPLFKAGVSDDPKAEAAKQFSGTEIHDKVEKIVNFNESVDLQTGLTEDLKASSAKFHEVHTEEETEYPCAKAAQCINGIEIFDLCHMHELEGVLVDPLFKAGVSDDPKAEAAKQFSGTEIHDKVENIVNFNESVDLQTALTEDLKASSAKFHEVHTEEETEYPCAKAGQCINGIEIFDLCHMHELEGVLVDPLFKAGVSDDPKAEAAKQFGGPEIHDKVENSFNFNESLDLQTALTKDLKASSAKLHEVHTEEETEYPCAKAAQCINGIETFDLCHMHELEGVLVDPLFKVGVSADPRAEAANQFGGTEIHEKVENIFNFNESVDLQNALTEDLKASCAKLHEVHTEKETEYPCAKAAQCINGIEIFDLCHMHELADVLGEPRLQAKGTDDPKAEAAKQFSGTEIHDKVENIDKVDPKVECLKQNTFEILSEPWNAKKMDIMNFHVFLPDESAWPKKYLEMIFGKKFLSNLMKEDNTTDKNDKNDKDDTEGKGGNDDH